MDSELLRVFTLIQKAIDASLDDEVATTGKEVISEKVDELIYEPEIPNQYPRRYENGGLGDTRMMHHTVDNGTLEITDDADFNRDFAESNSGYYGGVDLSKSLSYNVEFGYGSKNQWYNEERPFISESRDELAKGKARDALKNGLEKRLGKGVVTVT